MSQGCAFGSKDWQAASICRLGDGYAAACAAPCAWNAIPRHEGAIAPLSSHWMLLQAGSICLGKWQSQPVLVRFLLLMSPLFS